MLRAINNRTGGSLWIAAFVLVFSAWWSLSFAQTDTPEAPETTDESDVAEQEAQAAEDAAVDQVLKDAELIYEDKDADDFIPSQAVSADQSIDYPIDI